jgi:hypothetical protein
MLFSTLNRDMIERYGFWQGNTRYRVDPAAWINFLGLGGESAPNNDSHPDGLSRMRSPDRADGSVPSGTTEKTSSKPQPDVTVDQPGRDSPSYEMIRLDPAPLAQRQISGLGRRLGEGTDKIAYSHPSDPDKVLLQWKRDPGNPEPLQIELATLRYLAQLGIPVNIAEGVFKLEGTNSYAMSVPRVEGLFTKEESGWGNVAWDDLVRQHGQSMLDQINAIEAALQRDNLRIVDRQYIFVADGRVLVHDPIAIQRDSYFDDGFAKMWIDDIMLNMQRISRGERAAIRPFGEAHVPPPVDYGYGDTGI